MLTLYYSYICIIIIYYNYLIFFSGALLLHTFLGCLNSLSQVNLLNILISILKPKKKTFGSGFRGPMFDFS